MLRKAKYDYNRNIKLEDRKMITKDSEIAEVFNNVFANNRKFRNPLQFESHSIKCNIKETATFCDKIEFRKITVADVGIQIGQLNTNKASSIISMCAKFAKTILTYCVQSFKICTYPHYPTILSRRPESKQI